MSPLLPFSFIAFCVVAAILGSETKAKRAMAALRLLLRRRQP